MSTTDGQFDDQYEWCDTIDSLRFKDWAAGPLKRQRTTVDILDDAWKASTVTLMVSPALDKCTDELIVNALDQAIQFPKVTAIRVTFDANGCITVYNNGTGIPAVVHGVASQKLGKPVRVPELIFGYPFQGSNKKKKLGSIVGGTNGVGAKIANCHAVYFTLRTVHSGTCYSQKWTHNMSKAEPPVITSVKEADSTQITFMPDYTGDFEYKPDELRDEMRFLEAIVRTRVAHAACYMNTMSPATRVYFNGLLVPVCTVESFGKVLCPNAKVIPCTLDVNGYKWNVAALIKLGKTNVQQFAITNGVVCRGGQHLKHFTSKLCKSLLELFVTKVDSPDVRVTEPIIRSRITLLMCTAVPDANWEGQRKDELRVDANRFKGKGFPAEFISAVYNAIKDVVLFTSVQQKKATGKRKDFESDSYTPAQQCHGKHRLNCGLMFTEGVGAKNHMQMAVAHVMGLDWLGLMALKGVPMNARKHTTSVLISNGELLVTLEDSADSVHIRKKKLCENEELNGMMQALGLDPAYKYKPGSPTYDKEMQELRYGYAVMCVDQDLDGKGAILGLIVSFFELFWPELLRAGYLKWFITPIIRLYPLAAGKVLSFYSVAEYERTVSAPGFPIHLYGEPKYYKGLGTHTKEEMIHNLTNYKQCLLTIRLDEKAHDAIETYFGKDSSKRKEVLSLPAPIMAPELALQITTQRAITCSQLTMYEVDPYQRDNLDRKLWHFLDGQNQCGRMVLNYILTGKERNKNHKVPGLSGLVTKTQHYSHGEESLNSVIIGKAFIETGGKQLPFLYPDGNFGTRIEGGRDAAPPRYLWTHSNKRLLSALFPVDDYYLLPFTKQEGKYLYPDYFLPIIPMSILETAEVPAHGWKLTCWARDALATLDKVREYVIFAQNGYHPILRAGSLPIAQGGSNQRFRGSFVRTSKAVYSVGTYVLTGDDVCGAHLAITELPLCVWVTTFLAGKKSPLSAEKRDPTIVTSCSNLSSGKIDIRIRLAPGALGRIMAAYEAASEKENVASFDYIVWYFRLKSPMYDNLNMMGINKVMSFPCYETVFHHWFIQRKALYAERVRRRAEICRVNILLLSNKIRYVDEYQSMDLPGKEKTEMYAVLQARNFATMNVSMLEPTHIKTEDIYKEAQKGSYKYLLSMSTLGKTVAKRTQLAKELATLTQELASLRKESDKIAPGCDMWIAELDTLREIIEAGFATSWKFEDHNKFTL